MEVERHVIIDATGHIAGKLAGKVAKQLLEGVNVTVVCAEEAVFVGSFEKAKRLFREYLNKTSSVNPRKGPRHYREPRMHFRKIVKRMMKYKKYRGREALKRLKVYEGIQREFENKPRLKVVRCLWKYVSSRKAGCVSLGKLLSEFGWKYAKITKKLTEDLKERETTVLMKKKEEKKFAEELMRTEGFKEEVRKRLAVFEN